VAVHATAANDELTIRAFVADYDGTRSIRTRHSGRDPQQLISAVYDELMSKGAMELICATSR
jgi:porphobilinogen deaminase